MNTGLAEGSVQATAAPTSVSASEAVWQLLDEPFRAVDAARALFGLNPAAARYVVGRELLTSSEALRLLDAAPTLIRHLPNALSFKEVRSVGAVIGPIQWHSTIMARAAAGFPEDLFICAAPYRDFDLPENQLLLHCLKRLVLAGHHITALGPDLTGDDRISDAKVRARLANDFVEMRSFQGVVPKGDPATVRSAKRRAARSKQDAVMAFLPRLNRPLSSWALTHLGDRRTSMQHKVLLAVLATLRREGVEVRPFEPKDGVLVAGPVEYRHPGARGLAGAHGIRIGQMLLDVPDIPGDLDGAARRLGQRSGMLSPFIVESVADVAELTDQLLQEVTAPTG